MKSTPVRILVVALAALVLLAAIAARAGNAYGLFYLVFGVVIGGTLVFSAAWRAWEIFEGDV